jgi:hypothetical protein
MKITIKHPTDPTIDFVIKIEDSNATTMTIEQLLKSFEVLFQVNQNYDYAKYWKLRSCKTGKFIENTSICSEIDTDNNKFTIYWGKGD